MLCKGEPLPMTGPIGNLSFRRKRRSPTRIALADLARDNGDYEGAAHYYREALDRNPARSSIWVQLGHVLKESRKLEGAEAAYRTAHNFQPDDPDPLIHLAH